MCLTENVRLQKCQFIKYSSCDKLPSWNVSHRYVSHIYMLKLPQFLTSYKFLVHELFWLQLSSRKIGKSWRVTECFSGSMELSLQSFYAFSEHQFVQNPVKDCFQVETKIDGVAQPKIFAATTTTSIICP